MSTLNNAGAPEDVYNSLKCSWSSITEKQLRNALKDEKKKRNRKTVIKHLQRAIRNKQKKSSKF